MEGRNRNEMSSERFQMPDRTSLLLLHILTSAHDRLTVPWTGKAQERRATLQVRRRLDDLLNSRSRVRRVAPRWLCTADGTCYRWPDDESALKNANKKRKKAGEEESDEFVNKQSQSHRYCFRLPLTALQWVCCSRWVGIE